MNELALPFIYVILIWQTFAGFVWSKIKNTSPDWEIEAAFRISGRGRIGADGLVSLHTHYLLVCSYPTHGSKPERKKLEFWQFYISRLTFHNVFTIKIIYIYVISKLSKRTLWFKAKVWIYVSWKISNHILSALHKNSY